MIGEMAIAVLTDGALMGKSARVAGIVVKNMEHVVVLQVELILHTILVIIIVQMVDHLVDQLVIIRRYL
jgi:hypothetical protein